VKGLFVLVRHCRNPSVLGSYGSSYFGRVKKNRPVRTTLGQSNTRKLAYSEVIRWLFRFFCSLDIVTRPRIHTQPIADIDKRWGADLNTRF